MPEKVEEIVRPILAPQTQSGKPFLLSDELSYVSAPEQES
jgi:hypothetical protein